MNDVVARLAQRIARDPHCVGPTGFPFAAAAKATPACVADAEQALGFSLPSLLRRAYLEIANGGFGPGYGVMGIGDGFTDDQGNTVVDLYRGFRLGDPEDSMWTWPPELLPFCYWGCARYSAIDVTEEGNPVLLIDVAANEPGTALPGITLARSPSLKAWFADWLDGEDSSMQGRV